LIAICNITESGLVENEIRRLYEELQQLVIELGWIGTAINVFEAGSFPNQDLFMGHFD